MQPPQIPREAAEAPKISYLTKSLRPYGRSFGGNSLF